MNHKIVFHLPQSWQNESNVHIDSVVRLVGQCLSGLAHEFSFGGIDHEHVASLDCEVAPSFILNYDIHVNIVESEYPGTVTDVVSSLGLLETCCSALTFCDGFLKWQLASSILKGIAKLMGATYDVASCAKMVVNGIAYAAFDRHGNPNLNDEYWGRDVDGTVWLMDWINDPVFRYSVNPMYSRLTRSIMNGQYVLGVSTPEMTCAISPGTSSYRSGKVFEIQPEKEFLTKPWIDFDAVPVTVVDLLYDYQIRGNRGAYVPFKLPLKKALDHGDTLLPKWEGMAKTTVLGERVTDCGACLVFNVPVVGMALYSRSLCGGPWEVEHRYYSYGIKEFYVSHPNRIKNRQWKVQ